MHASVLAALTCGSSLCTAHATAPSAHARGFRAAPPCSACTIAPSAHVWFHVPVHCMHNHTICTCAVFIHVQCTCMNAVYACAHCAQVLSRACANTCACVGELRRPTRSPELHTCVPEAQTPAGTHV